MKTKYSILIIGLFLCNFSIGQITTREISQKEVPKPKSYDSTFCAREYVDYKIYIGQTVFFPPKSKKFIKFEETVKYDGFSSAPLSTNGTKESFYRPIVINEGDRWGEKWYEYGSDYKSIANNYFKIIDVVDKNHKESRGEHAGTFFKLLNISMKDTAYYRVGKYDPYIIVGNFEYLKKNIIGENYYFIGNPYGQKASIETNDINTGKIINVGIGSMWTCTDFTMIDLEQSYYSVPVFVFKNESGSEILVEAKDYKSDLPIKMSFLKSKRIIDHEESEKLKKSEQLEAERKKREIAERIAAEKFKNECIAKFGTTYGNLICQGKVVIGMTKEMCILSWGEPLDKNITTTTYGSSEQWVYSLKHYLYFEGNKLTAIQN